jgi:hypothetical protein
MPAVSKAQQKFFGIVRAIQKGEMAPTTPETAKTAATMKKKDVKDFASTKHKGLPMKKEVKEGDYWHPDPKKDAQISGQGNKQRAREDRPSSSKPVAKKQDPKKLRKGESYYDYAKRQKGASLAPKPKERKRDKIGRKLGNLVDRVAGIKKEEAYYGGEEQRKKDERKAKYEKQLKKMLPKRAFDSMGRELDPRSGKLKEERKTFKEFMRYIE